MLMVKRRQILYYDLFVKIQSSWTIFFNYICETSFALMISGVEIRNEPGSPAEPPDLSCLID